MQSCDIAVIGAGASGMMAAIRAAGRARQIILIEKNASPGKKILLCGKGRCNLTNIAGINEFIAKFGKQGEFLRSAFSAFFNQDLINFFKAKGLELKVERQGRVFPVTDQAASVLEVLEAYLRENKVKILYNRRLLKISLSGDSFFNLSLSSNEDVQAKKVILATGGASFSFTGSSGEGLDIISKLGHTVIPLKPGLAPLKTKELWVKSLQGLTLKNIRLTFKGGGKKIISDIGELLFTYFGVSGPLVLDLSNSILDLLGRENKVALYVDLKPGLTCRQLEERLLREFIDQGDKNIKNILKSLLPQKLILIFLSLLPLEDNKKGNQVSKEERLAMVNLLKAFPLSITGSLPLDQAMVTCGGVSTKEINPRTMESRIIPGLYFAGEIIDASASSGGYNLQQAFSTGYLAGEQAVKSLGSLGV